MLNILVVGAGIAGLSTAISLRRAGHCVHVYERSSFKNEIGAAINIPPNATRFLIAWGLDPAKFRFVQSRKICFMDPFSLDVTDSIASDKMSQAIGGADLYYAHRVDLHNALKWMATREDGPGVPVTIHLGANAISYDPARPSIVLEGGQEIQGDLVVGADGIHSGACEAVLGHDNPPVAPIHYNYCYRFLIPAAALEEDTEARHWNKGRDGCLRIIPHNNTKRRIVVYPCRECASNPPPISHPKISAYAVTATQFIISLVLCMMKTLSQEQRKVRRKLRSLPMHFGGSQLILRADWQDGVHVSHVLEKFSDYNPKLLKVMSKATQVKRWPLLYRRPLSIWHKGRMTLAGDSAHPMLPHQGQGGAQGLEDGLALGIVLHGARGAKEIERRLEIYSRLRRNRASVIQILSNVGQDQIELVRDELRQYMKEEDIPSSPADIYKYNFGYDIVRATLDAMKTYDPRFRLPSEFFEREVAGVPAR